MPSQRDKGVPIIGDGGTAERHAPRGRWRLIFVLAVLLPPAILLQQFLSTSSRSSELSHQLESIRTLVRGCIEHARDNEGAYPADLEELVPEYLDDAALLHTDATSSGEPEAYLYRPGADRGTGSESPWSSRRHRSVNGGRSDFRVDASRWYPQHR